MIRLILHQIWNQRRQNLWIWLELVLLSVFLWLAIDPLFTTVCVTQSPRGYEIDGLYCLYPRRNFKKTYFFEDNFVPQMDHLLTRISEHPLVEQVCLFDNSFFVGEESGVRYSFVHCNGNTQTGQTQQNDSITSSDIIGISVVEGLEKWADLPGTLRMRDAMSGEILHACTDATARDRVYLSAKMAGDHYGTLQARDSLLGYTFRKYNLLGEQHEGRVARVGGVFADIKTCDYRMPVRLTLTPVEGFYMTNLPLVRVKEGVDEDEFREAIRRDVLSRCTLDDVTGYDVVSLKETVRKCTERSGAYNTIRLRSAMGFFGLLCAFLGVSGLFWVRCNDRRQDMGILRSMGASRGDVRRQMLAEAALLLTLAFLPAMLYIGWHVHANGYDVGLAESSMAGKADMAYWFNRPVPHVLSVTVLTYVSMLLITLLATWLPVHRATRISPCDALRDE